MAHSCQYEEVLATPKHPYHFLESGLPDVYLEGIRFWECSCGRTKAEIPALKQLLQEIARGIVSKPQALSGDEIKYLRKRMGQKQADFAAEIGMEPETLSRLETGALPITETNDKFIRMYYALTSDDIGLRQQVQAAIKKLTESFTPPKKKPMSAKLSGSKWKAAIAA